MTTSKLQHHTSRVAAAVSAALLGLTLGGSAIAQTAVTNASGSTTVNASNSGSGAVSAAGSTTVNAATVSGSGIAAGGTAAPVETAGGTPTMTTALQATTNAAGSTTVDAANTGSGNVNASGSTTVNAATVSGSGVAASGTSAPVTGTTAGVASSTTTTPTSGVTGSTTTASTTNGAVSGTGNTIATAPGSTINGAVSGTGNLTTGTAASLSPTGSTTSASSSSTSNATATANNDIDIFLPGGTTITGKYNIVGDNNIFIKGNKNTISTATTTTTATNGSATGTTEVRQASGGAAQEALSGEGALHGIGRGRGVAALSMGMHPSRSGRGDGHSLGESHHRVASLSASEAGEFRATGASFGKERNRLSAGDDSDQQRSRGGKGEGSRKH